MSYDEKLVNNCLFNMQKVPNISSFGQAPLLIRIDSIFLVLVRIDENHHKR